MRRRARTPVKTLGYRLQGDELEIQTDIETMSGHAAGAYVYSPRPDQMIPPDGAWVMITRELSPIERDLHKQFIVGGVFFAERLGETDAEGFPSDGRYRVRVNSPWGEVVLWPYEYAVKDAVHVTELWGEGALEFTATSIEQARLNDVVFYCRQRCIGLADAMVMALGTLKGSVGYFLPPESVREDLRQLAEAINRPLSDPVHQKRRAEARRRRQQQEENTP